MYTLNVTEKIRIFQKAEKLIYIFLIAGTKSMLQLSHAFRFLAM